MFGMPVAVNHIAITMPSREAWLEHLAYLQKKGVKFDRRVEHGLDASQPALPAEKRDVRLMAHVTRQRRFVPVFDVRWIGGDQIEWTCYAVEK